MISDAQGMVSDPITFTSAAATPSPGDWGGISFGDSTDDENTKLSYCIIEYGGKTYNYNIKCENSAPTIQNCIIRKSSQYGIYVTGSEAAPTIECCDIKNHFFGVYADTEVGSGLSVNHCNITDNFSYGVYSIVSTISAENNWWGDTSGPGGAGPGGWRQGEL